MPVSSRLGRDLDGREREKRKKDRVLRVDARSFLVLVIFRRLLRNFLIIFEFFLWKFEFCVGFLLFSVIYFWEYFSAGIVKVSFFENKK